MYPYYQNYYRGVSTPSFKTNINPLNGRKTTSMRSLILNAEKSIDTISSLIPLYQKVQPVISQGKNIISSIINTFKTKQSKIATNKKVEKVDAEILPTFKENNTNTNFDYRNQDNNNKPFFN